MNVKQVIYTPCCCFVGENCITQSWGFRATCFVRADARGLADCEELFPMLRRSDEKCGLKQTVAALAAFTSLSSKA